MLRVPRGVHLILLLLTVSPVAAAQDLGGGDPVPGAPQPQPSQPHPDLVASDMHIDPEEPDDESPFTLCARIDNYGNGDPTPFTIALTIDGDGVFEKRYDTFPRSGDDVCTTTRAERGVHDYELIVDVDEEVIENTEANNRRIMRFAVGEPKRADLTVALFVTPDPPRRGETLAFAARVKNVGAAHSAATTLNFTYDGVVIRESAIPALAPGGGYVAGAALASHQLREGDHGVTAAVDPRGLVAELNEANNQASRTLNIPRLPLPDLVVAEVNWTDPVRESALANFTVRVVNQGDVSAEPFVVRIAIDNATVLAAPKVPGLAPGASVNLTASWTARAPGNHSVTVTLDPHAVVGEDAEDNNEATRRFLVRPKTDLPPLPDLVVDRVLHLPRTPVEGAPVNVTAVVRNDGPVRAGAFAVTFEVDGEVFHTARFTSLAPGGFVASVATLRAGAGGHVVNVTVDEGDALVEIDDGNNAKFVSLLVAAAGLPSEDDVPATPPTNGTAGGNVTRPPTNGTVPPAPASPPGEAKLVVLSVSYVGAPETRYIARIRNDGNAVAGAFNVRFDVDGVPSGTQPVAGLAPGRDISVTWGPHRDPSFRAPDPGEHALRVVILKQGDASPDGAAFAEAKFVVEGGKGVPAPPAAVVLAFALAVALALARARRAR